MVRHQFDCCPDFDKLPEIHTVKLFSAIFDSVNSFSQKQFQPFGIRQSADYDIRLQVTFHVVQVIHVHVPFCAPLGTGYMAQSGTYEH